VANGERAGVAPRLGPLFLALLVAALPVHAATPDGGTDTPFKLEPAGTVLQVDAVCALPTDVQAYDVALRTAQADADSGTQKAVTVGLITGAAGLVLGAVVAGIAVAYIKK
jgi:hypothetical protein